LGGRRWATRALALGEVDERKAQYLREGGALIASSLSRQLFAHIVPRSRPSSAAGADFFLTVVELLANGTSPPGTQ
jgi:hypothetical protein